MLFVTYTWDYVRSYWDLIERHAPAGAQQAPAAAAAPAPAQNLAQPLQPLQPIPQAQAEIPQDTQRPEAPPASPSSHVHGHVQAPGERPQETQAPQTLPITSSSNVQGHIQEVQDEGPLEDPASGAQPSSSSSAAQGHIQPPAGDAPEQAFTSVLPEAAHEAQDVALPDTQGSAQGHPAAAQPEMSGAPSSSGVLETAANTPGPRWSSPASSPDNQSMITGESAAAAQPVSSPEDTSASGSDFYSEEMTPGVHDPGQAAYNAMQASAAPGDPFLGTPAWTDGLSGPSSGADAATQPHVAQPAGSLLRDAPEAPAPLAPDNSETTAEDANNMPPNHDVATPMGRAALAFPARGADAAGEAGPVAGDEGAAGQAAAAQAAQGTVIDADGLDAAGAPPAPAAGAAAAENAGPAPGEELQVCSRAQLDVHTLLSLLAMCWSLSGLHTALVTKADCILQLDIRF